MQIKHVKQILEQHGLTVAIIGSNQICIIDAYRDNNNQWHNENLTLQNDTLHGVDGFSGSVWNYLGY